MQMLRLLPLHAHNYRFVTVDFGERHRRRPPWKSKFIPQESRCSSDVHDKQPQPGLASHFSTDLCDGVVATPSGCDPCTHQRCAAHEGNTVGRSFETARDAYHRPDQRAQDDGAGDTAN
jgi:hypothetical protein